MAHNFLPKSVTPWTYCKVCETACFSAILHLTDSAMQCKQCGDTVHQACRSAADAKPCPAALDKALVKMSTDTKSRVRVKVIRCDNLSAGDGQKDYVSISAHGRKEYTSAHNTDHSHGIEFLEMLDLGELALQDVLTVQTKAHKLLHNCSLAQTCISVAELCKRPDMTLMFQNPDGSMVVKQKTQLPTTLTLAIDASELAPDWPKPELREGYGDDFARDKYHRHVMIISRGTRGDVQPFVALARGLAEMKGWMVTIVTESRWKSFVKDNAKGLTSGMIRFRPSGGDTMQRTDTAVAKWAMQHKSEVMQLMMVSNSEAEFFNSEPMFYYWAKEMKPDTLCFGFNLANLAMIVSEALKIPMIGFILQPTCIPSEMYLPVVPINTHVLGVFDQIEESITTHSFEASMKRFWENNPFTGQLNTLRKQRGLNEFGSHYNTWLTIVDQDIPIIAPINAHCFGGKPPEWHAHAELTDFIFLRGAGVPKIAPDLQKFLDDSKATGHPTVVMAFSSMPVERLDIAKIVIRMCDECEKKPNVIALVGPRKQEDLPPKYESRVKELKAQGRMFEAAGASFGMLFELVDCVIMHGGLGTTAEALRAGKPTMVTGVLLMDQRFWGDRVHKLGVGPPPCHVTDFEKVCVENVNACLKDGSKYAKAAKELVPLIQCQSEDGVKENVEAFERLVLYAEQERVLVAVKKKPTLWQSTFGVPTPKVQSGKSVS